VPGCSRTPSRPNAWCAGTAAPERGYKTQMMAGSTTRVIAHIKDPCATYPSGMQAIAGREAGAPRAGPDERTPRAC
jgi:hypothetical protein